MSLVGTTSLSLLYPTKYLILIIAFALGFGDALVQNQTCSLLGVLYPAEAEAACRKSSIIFILRATQRNGFELYNSFSLFQFTACSTSAAAFFYSTFIGLHLQLALLLINLFTGVACYLIIEINL